MEVSNAIVSSANRRLKFNNGIAKEVFKAGGNAIKEDAETYVKKHGALSVGQVAVTWAGNMKFKFVFHLVAPVYKADNPTTSERYLYKGI